MNTKCIEKYMKFIDAETGYLPLWLKQRSGDEWVRTGV